MADQLRSPNSSFGKQPSENSLRHKEHEFLNPLINSSNIIHSIGLSQINIIIIISWKEDIISIKRVHWTSNHPTTYPSIIITLKQLTEATEFQHRKSVHREEPEIDSCVKRLESRRETNAGYVDQPPVHGQMLPDMPGHIGLKPPALQAISPVSHLVIDLSDYTPSRITSTRSPGMAVGGFGGILSQAQVDDVEDQPEIVLSAKRVPKIKAGENLSHASNLEANTRLYLPESLESPSTGNHPSSKDEVITAASDEHKQKDIEEAKIAPKKEPPLWEFAARYMRAAQGADYQQRQLPKTRTATASSSARSPQMNPHKRKIGGGGPQPKNTLQNDQYNNKNANPHYRNPAKRPESIQGFDLHKDIQHAQLRDEHYPNKRPRNERGNYKGSAGSPIDVEGSQAQVAQATQSQNYQGRNTSRRGSGVYEYMSVENTMRSEKRPRNRTSNTAQGRPVNMSEDGSHKLAVGPHAFKQGDMGPPADDISDVEESKTLVFLHNQPRPVIQVSSRERTAADDKNLKPVLENGHKSPYFLHKGDKKQASNSSYSRRSQLQSSPSNRNGPTNQRMNASKEPSRTRTAVTEHESSPDPICCDKPNTPPDQDDEQVAKDLINKFKLSNQSQHFLASRKSGDTAFVVPSDSESDENTENNIKTTTFTSKTPKDLKTKPDDKYEVLQVFSEGFKWLLGGTGQKWSVLQNFYTRTLMFLNHEGVPVPELCLVPNSISKIECNDESSKMILHKSIDQTAHQQHQIMVELRSPHEASLFRKHAENYSNVIKILCKDAEHLDKVFDNYSKKINQKSRLSNLVRDEVKIISQNANSGNDEGKTKKQEINKEGRRLRDGMMIAKSDKPLEKGASTESQQLSNVRYEDTSRIQPRQLEHSQGLSRNSNQSSSDLASYGTRSSSRIQTRGQKTTQRRSVSPVARLEPISAPWTEANKGWTTIWKKSVFYPKVGKNKSTVDKDDIIRLNEGEFLNDNLIHFYFNFLEQRLLNRRPEDAKRILFMNTFFYERLTSGERSKNGVNYDAVERWTSKVDVFKYDYIVVPVCEQTHWYLAIICNASKLVEPSAPEESESQGDAEVVANSVETHVQPEVDAQLTKMSLDEANTNTTRSKAASGSPVRRISEATHEHRIQSKHTVATKPAQAKKPKRKSLNLSPETNLKIVTLDSLGYGHSPACVNLRSWLMAEAESKRGLIVPNPGSIGMKATYLPQQPNYCDCGLYLLIYLEKFLDDPDPFAKNILTHTEDLDIEWPQAPDKRTEIRKLLFFLQDHPSADIKELEAGAKTYCLPIDTKKKLLVSNNKPTIDEMPKAEAESINASSSSSQQHDSEATKTSSNSSEEQNQSRLPTTTKKTPTTIHVSSGESEENESQHALLPAEPGGASMLNKLKSEISSRILTLIGGEDKSPARREALTPKSADSEVPRESRSTKDRPIEIADSPAKVVSSIGHATSLILRSPSPDILTAHVVGERCNLARKQALSRQIPIKDLEDLSSSESHASKGGSQVVPSLRRSNIKAERTEVGDSQDDDFDDLLSNNVESQNTSHDRASVELLSEFSALQSPTTPEQKSTRKQKPTPTKSASKIRETRGADADVPSISKVRKRRNEEVYDGPQDLEPTQPHRNRFLADPSDASIVGRHATHVGRDDNDNQLHKK